MAARTGGTFPCGMRARATMAAWMALAATVLLALAKEAEAQTSCYENPTQELCATFEHPSNAASAEVANLCMMMDWMPGCSVENECALLAAEVGEDGMDANSTRYCASFSVLADICYADMPMMSGCRNYTSLCAAGSVVEQCTEQTPLPGLPTTETVALNILGICTSHAMDGCELCTIDAAEPTASPGCDLMTVYSSLCLKMPMMAECAEWQLMCESVSSWSSWCPSSDPSAGQPPIMRMYFHTGIVDYVLFYGWVPRTDGQYIATLLAIVAIAIAYEALRTVRHYCECRWAALAGVQPLAAAGTVPVAGTNAYEKLNDTASLENAKAPVAAGTPYPGWAPQPFRLRVDLLRGLLHATETLLSYSLMLIAMTFNIGMVLAGGVGMFFGAVLFARYRAYQPAAAACC